MAFCVVFSLYIHGRLEADWRNFNDVADDISLFDRKTLHKMSMTCQSGSIRQYWVRLICLI